ncbi:putative E3 ubiquitin ligase, UBR4 [Helianthus debilis subsp. tardiflorus]
MCMLISLLCGQSSSRRFRLLNLLMSLLPATLSAGKNAAEYFELIFKMIETEDTRLFLTVCECLITVCKLITQEEFIRGSMTKNPYSSVEIGPLMCDVKNKICNQLDLLGLIEDDYGMELLVAGNIISRDLSITQVYDHVWKKSSSQSTNMLLLPPCFLLLLPHQQEIPPYDCNIQASSFSTMFCFKYSSLLKCLFSPLLIVYLIFHLTGVGR